MQKHTKKYLKEMGYTDTDFIPSELSGVRANDIHHIIGRGKCGEDRIENLMALTRSEHLRYGDKKKYMNLLLFHHEQMLIKRGVKYSKDWFRQKHKQYDSYVKLQ